MSFRVISSCLLCWAVIGCGSGKSKKSEDEPDRPPAPEETPASDPQDPRPDEDAGLTEVEPVGENNAVTRYRGILEIEQLIRDRLLSDEQDTPFYLTYYFSSNPPLRQFFPEFGLLDLERLFGYYDGQGLEVTFRNGEPNAVNMLLWYVVLDGVAGDLAARCADAEDPEVVLDLALAPSLTSAIDRLCQWPEANEEDLRNLWAHLLRWDAPVEEIDAYAKFFADAEWESVPSRELVQTAAIVALYNPYFLLYR